MTANDVEVVTTEIVKATRKYDQNIPGGLIASDTAQVMSGLKTTRTVQYCDSRLRPVRGGGSTEAADMVCTSCALRSAPAMLHGAASSAV
jgi:hypothetical protein